MRHVLRKKIVLPHERGITLLLVVVILAAILSVSVGIFNVIIGQLFISGEISDSFIALYAADEGTEKTLYRDRILDECTPPSCSVGPITTAAQSCYTVSYTRIGTITSIKSVGQYRCEPTATRITKRGLEVTY